MMPDASRQNQDATHACGSTKMKPLVRLRARLESLRTLEVTPTSSMYELIRR